MAIHKIKLKVGTVYQKEENGIYYFRYQVNGKRKAASLGTRNRHSLFLSVAPLQSRYSFPDRRGIRETGSMRLQPFRKNADTRLSGNTLRSRFDKGECCQNQYDRVIPEQKILFS